MNPPAVNDDGTALGGVRVCRVSDEGDQRQCVQGDAVVGPGGEVILVDGARRRRVAATLAAAAAVGHTQAERA